MDKHINLIAPINQFGYGVASTNILKHLHFADWRVSLFIHGNESDDISDEDKEIVKTAKENAKLFNNSAPCLNIWHQFNLERRIGKGKLYGFPIFELDTFNEVEKHHLKSVDEIIVASEWAKNVILENKIKQEKRVHVVPLGVDYGAIKMAVDHHEDEGGPFVFLNVGKWEKRKGHDVLVDMFNGAFSPDDDVELWMMPNNPFLTQGERYEWEHMYISSPMGRAGKIRLFPWLTRRDMLSTIVKAHCGVFPSRAEGFNLGLLEMMAAGKHVITTDCTAHTQFCTQENAMLVDIDEYEPANDSKWFFEQGNWAKLGPKQVDDFTDRMKTIYENRSNPGTLINEQGVVTAQNFTWRNTVECLEQILI